MNYRVPIWWYELHGTTVRIDKDDVEDSDEAEQQAAQVVEYLGDHGYEFTRTFCDKADCGLDFADEDEEAYLVPIWWQELHGDGLELEADSAEEAEQQAVDIVKYLGDHDYDFTDTFSDKGSCGVDDPIPMKEDEDDE